MVDNALYEYVIFGRAEHASANDADCSQAGRSRKRPEPDQVRLPEVHPQRIIAKPAVVRETAGQQAGNRFQVIATDFPAEQNGRSSPVISDWLRACCCAGRPLSSQVKGCKAGQEAGRLTKAVAAQRFTAGETRGLE